MAEFVNGLLRGMSFVALWGKSLAIQADGLWSWIDDADAAFLTGDAIIIRLAPHLEILSLGFALPRPSSSPGQLDLFPVRGVSDGASSEKTLKLARSPASPSTGLRQRSA
jgi:hypothetical protein